MEQHFVVMRLRRRATLLALSKYEFTFNVYNILTNDDLFLSHFVAVGLALAGLFVALVILLVVVWAKKMKRVQKRLKRLEMELREEEIYYSVSNPHFSSQSRGDDEM